MSSGLYSGVSGLALGVGLYKDVSGLWSGASGLIDGFAGTSPYSGASLYLDFLSMTAPTFDNRITFSRGTNATLTDSTGRVTYAPANLATFSEFPNGVTDAPVRGGLVTGTSFAGLNSNTGLAFGYDGATTSFAYKTVAIAAVSHILSVYVRMDDGNAPSFGSSTSANPANSFVLVIGGNATNPTTYAVTNLGGGLYRVAVRDASAAGTHNNGVVKYNTNDNRTFKVSGYQLEPVTYQTTPSTYVATTASAYYGPRFDYDPVTLAPRGLLIEEQRVNLTLHSGLTSANWTATGGTLANTGKLSPDGSSNMGLFTEDSATSAHQTFVTTVPGTLTLGVTYTGSVYIAAGTRRYVVVQCGTNGSNWGVTVDTQTWTITGDFATGGCAFTSASIVNAGNGIYRVTATGVQNTGGGTPAYVVVGGSLIADAVNSATSYLGNGSTFYAWGAQLEAGAFATSYIPTVASQVTRTADVAEIGAPNFAGWFNQSSGTFVAEFQTVALRAGGTTGHRVVAAYDGTASNVSYLYTYAAIAGGQIVTGGVLQADLNGGGSPANNTTIKSAMAYATNDVAATVNGATPTTDTSATMPTVNRLGLGSQGASQLNGWLRSVRYYPTRLTNAQLQALTA